MSADARRHLANARTRRAGEASAARHAARYGPVLVALLVVSVVISRAQRPRRAVQTTAGASDTQLLGGGGGHVIRAGVKATAVVLFLHGYGDTPRKYLPLLVRPLLAYADVVFPQAPTAVAHERASNHVSSWTAGASDFEGSVARIDRLVRGLPVPPSRVAVVGMSQGGALALTYALRSKRAVGGVAALSCWLPQAASYPGALGPDARTMRVFLAHGGADRVVSPRSTRATAARLRQCGVQRIETHTYPALAHWIGAEEVDDLRRWLTHVLPPI